MAVLATTGLDDAGRPAREALKPDGTTQGVLTTSSLVVRFDRFLLPNTAVRQAVCVQPFVEAPRDDQGCPGGEFLEPTYDPVRLEIVFRQPAGARFRRGSRYQITVWQQQIASIFGVRSFDGVGMREAVRVQFTTEAADTPGAPEETRDERDVFCTNDACRADCAGSSDPDACAERCANPVRDTLATCALGGCHAPTRTEAQTLGPAAGLDLRDAASIARTAIGRAAMQTQRGERPNVPSAGGDLGRPMPIVDPLAPGNSYLLYKLAVHEAYVGRDGYVGASEAERARGSFVRGLPMPARPARALSAQDLDAIVTWIAQGAPTSCPP